MSDHLVMTLAANLGAMGDLAGYERRGTWGWPARSAIIGLLGASLGLRREDDFSALDGLEIAVGIYDSGEVLRDYHTVETVPAAVSHHANSRPEALRQADGKTNTTVTLRDYRSGPVFAVAIQGDNLPMLSAALARPVFQLYLGRKSCPLSAPLMPHIVDAKNLIAALEHTVLPFWHWKQQMTPEGYRYCARPRLIAVIAEETAGLSGQRLTRNDAVLDRTIWHFGPRTVTIHYPEDAG